MESENEISTAVLIEPESVGTLNGITSITNGIINDEPITFQKLEEKAAKAQEALEKEEKLRKELEALNSKLLAEKTALLDSLSGEKGALQDYQEKSAKLTAQKNDLDNQLRVSIKCLIIEEKCENFNTSQIFATKNIKLLMSQLSESWANSSKINRWEKEVENDSPES